MGLMPPSRKLKPSPPHWPRRFEPTKCCHPESHRISEPMPAVEALNQIESEAKLSGQPLNHLFLALNTIDKKIEAIKLDSPSALMWIYFTDDGRVEVIDPAIDIRCYRMHKYRWLGLSERIVMVNIVQCYPVTFDDVLAAITRKASVPKSFTQLWFVTGKPNGF